MNMKQTLLILVLCLSLLLAACGGQQPASQGGAAADGKLKVTVTTSFLQDMVTQLAGPYVDISLIIPAGGDPHLYTAKPEDLKKVQDAQLLLYHGLHFEGKIQDILEQKGVAVSKDFPQDKIGKMDEGGTEVIDPHFWFDISLYKLATKTAAAALMEKIPAHKADIEKNLQAYEQKLDELDAENRKLLEQIPAESRYLVTPHDAFNYFSRAYNMQVVAPQGVSTDSEVANADIDAVVKTIVEHKIKAIFAESTTDPARMKKIQEACAAKGFKVKVVSGEGQELFSDSLAPKGEPGDTYIDMYRHNIKLIVENMK